MALPSTVVCNNILKRSFDENVSISPMKLQKLLYFVCCEYAKNTNERLLSEDFCVWKYGPVIPALYAEFKSFGSSPISKYATDANGSVYIANEDTDVNFKKAVNVIWKSMKEFSGIMLSQITHLENSAWSNAYQNNEDRITLEAMKEDRTYVHYMFS